MRTLCRKLLQLLRHIHQHQDATAAERRRVFFLDHNDLSDLQQYIAVRSCCYYLNSCGPKKTCSYSYSEIRQLCKPVALETYRIAAFWTPKMSADSKDCAFGAVLGAFVGDAAGGVLEFMQGKPSSDEVRVVLARSWWHLPSFLQ